MHVLVVTWVLYTAAGHTIKLYVRNFVLFKILQIGDEENSNMAAFGKIDEFHCDKEEWEDYVDRLESYFLANDITTEAKKAAILLSCVGAKTYKLIKDLLSPTKPSTKTFQQICELVKTHHRPKKSVIISRYQFNGRIRHAGESVNDYIAQLRHLAKDCDFGGDLETKLRDQIVIGINDETILNKLLTEPDTMTYKQAVDIALAAEVASKDLQTVQKSHHSVHHASSSVKSKQQRGVTKASSQSTTKSSRSLPDDYKCFTCGGKHLRKDCRYRNSTCSKCNKRGHLARICRNESSRSQSCARPGSSYNSSRDTHDVHHRDTSVRSRHASAHVITDSVPSDSDSTDLDVYSLYHVLELCNSSARSPISVVLNVNGISVDFEVDTGASVTLVSDQMFRSNWPDCTLRPSMSKLKTYTGESIPVAGLCDVHVSLDDQTATLPLTVVQYKGPNLLGRNWLKHIRLDWNKIFHIHEETLDAVLNKHKDVFKEGLGEFKGPAAKIHLDESVPPKFHKARPVPYSMKVPIEQELARLVKEGVIEPVEYSEWACPIVPIIKSDFKIRICGDYSTTINSASKLDRYPLPKIEDLYATLANGQAFSKLDLSHAYQQIVLDKSSKPCTTINTHQGLFVYNRLPFGVSSSPGIFQRIMDGLLSNLPGVAVYLDDILITGKTQQEHLNNLSGVLQKLSDAGLRLKKEKCSFLASSVVYLGHKITSEGLYPVADKVEAIRQSPEPTDVHTLKSFLGMVNHYHRFLCNLSTVLSPLYQLLKKNVVWRWGPNQRAAFQKAKDMLLSSKVLVHFDSNLPLILECDASQYGVGSILSHQFPDGSERPIGFVSRTLTPAEKKYSQLEKEGLAIIFGVKRFHNYIFGQHFTIRSDHKPLKYLFSEDRPVPVMASARIQRWALTLSAYEYNMEYRSGKSIPNADALSRLPLDNNLKEIPQPGDIVLLMDILDNSPITSTMIKNMTTKDPDLLKVIDYIQKGWPDSTQYSDVIKPFHRRCLELSVENGCIMWGRRVFIPKCFRQSILHSLHDSHPGVCRMKSYARSYFWWPRLDSDIEALAQQCQSCQESRKSPPESPLTPWEFPQTPWHRIHIDHAGPFLDKLFLVIVDAYSKWLEVIPVSSTSSQVTIDKLRQVFAIHGLPHVLVSDNATSFTSAEFNDFIQHNGIKHIRSAPFHPSTNGLAERAIQTVKRALAKESGGSLKTRLATFLLQYRTTPHVTTGVTPAELLMGRRLSVPFDLLYPNLSHHVYDKQCKQKFYHDRTSKQRQLFVGDHIYARNYARGPKWLAGIIIKQSGPTSFLVKLTDGRVQHRHIDQILLSQSFKHTEDTLPGTDQHDTLVAPKPLQKPVPEDQTPPNSEPSQVNVEQNPDLSHPQLSDAKESSATSSVSPEMSSVPSTVTASPSITLRRSTRISVPPDRLSYH